MADEPPVSSFLVSSFEWIQQMAKYQDLVVWQKAMALAKEIYLVTKQFPADERFGLVSQMRRAAVSVPSNIAEGQGRLTPGEFRQFLGQARGSLYEVETQAQLSADFDLIQPTQLNSLIQLTTEVSRLLNGLLKSLK